MTAHQMHLNGSAESYEGESRRNFLFQLSALCASVLFLPSNGRASLTAEDAARIDAQWKRIARVVPKRTLDRYQVVANKLAPRVETLLSSPQWESQIYQAVAKELKTAQLYPNRQPPLDAPCAKEKESSRLRGDAASTTSTPNAVKAASNVAAATVATISPLGPIIAAVLIAIAAVIILLGNIIAEAKEDEAAAKDKNKSTASEDSLSKIRKLELELARTMERLDDCLLFGRKAR